MTLDPRVMSVLQRVGRLDQRTTGRVGFDAVIGDGNGNISLPSNSDFYYFRRPSFADDDNTTGYSPLGIALASGNSLVLEDGFPCRVEFEGNQAVIKSPKAAQLISVGINPRIMNWVDPYNKFVQMAYADIGYVKRVGTSNTQTMEILVKAFYYLDDTNNYHVVADTQLDLVSSIPAAAGGVDQQLIAAVFLKPDDTFTIVTSTAISRTDTLTHVTDLSEVFDNAPARALPLRALVLYTGQTFVSDIDEFSDIRGWLNTPERLNNYSAAVDPTVNDDIDLNYEPGSRWFNNTDEKIFETTDTTDGAAKWHLVHGFPVFKSYTTTTQGLGANPDIFTAGFYEFSAADANLTQASTTQVFGDASVSHASHAFAVAAAAGSVDTGVIGLRVNGTSITDTGVRTTSDTETIFADITAVVTDQYGETTKKWLGQITYELFVVSGAPTTYSLDFNYGLTKYEDFSNFDFTADTIECTGFAGASDSDFDIKLLHHKPTGWTYSAAAFTPIIAANTLASLVGDHSTDNQLTNQKHTSWKHIDIDTAINAANGEGLIIFISSSANNAVEYMNCHIGVKF